MKKNNVKNKLKLALFATAMLAIGTANSQTTTGDAAVEAKTGKAAKAGESIRLIDNKGTIKYMQSNNGITTITSTFAGNRTVTTWQLGGTLLDETYIDVNGKAFALDGVARVDTATESAADAAGALTLSKHGDAGASGYTLLVRDEATGATKKLLVTDLVESAQDEYSALAADETANTKDLTLDFKTTVGKIFVFRNGAKLRANIDYTLAVDGVTLTVAPPAGAVDPHDWVLYTGDILEYHYSK